MHTPRRAHRQRWTLPLIASAVFGCGTTPIQERIVEVPREPSTELGAPTSVTYSADLEPQRDLLRVTVYEEAQCEKFRVETFDRYRERRRGDELLSKEFVGKGQRPSESLGKVPCGKTFARDVQVSLRVGTEVVLLGITNKEGQVAANLTDRLASDALGIPDAKGTLLVRSSYAPESAEAGELALDFLRANDEKVQSMLAELATILDKDRLSKADIRRSYELYESLRRVSWYDARFKGIAARFWELFFERKEQDASEALGRNLKALEASKELLRTANLSAIPLFVQAAVNAGSVNPRTLEWARSRFFGGLLATPKVCAGPFSWGAVPGYGLSPEQLVALNYLRFAFGDGFSQRVAGMCGRL